ncbi:MAG: CcdB family protein [Actinomycetota bacterium]
MAQFDVYPNPVMPMGEGAPYLVDIQDDGLAALHTRIVVPLVRPEAVQPLRRLNPVVEVGGERLVLVVQNMGAVPRDVLRDRVASLEHRRDDIVAALDFLFTGI